MFNNDITLDSIKRLDLRRNGYRKLILLGKTGSGKSALCNSLCQKPKTDDNPYKTVFPEAADMEVGNTDTILTEIKYLGKWNRTVSLIDTVGFDNAKQRTSDIADLIYALKERCDYINVFGIVVAAPKRIEESLKDTIKIFVDLFGQEIFWRNAVLLFTNMDCSDAAVAKRNKNSQTDAKMISNFQNTLKFMFGFKREIPAVIMDAHYDGGNTNEKKRFSDAAEILYQWVTDSSFQNCLMVDMNAVIAKYQKYEGLEQSLEVLRQKHAKAMKIIKEQEEANSRRTKNVVKIAATVTVAVGGVAGTILGFATGNQKAASACATATAGALSALVSSIDLKDLD